MHHIISIILVLFLVLLSSYWQGADHLLAESQSMTVAGNWEEVTASPVSIPDENVEYQFNLFLSENVSGDYSLSTLEWLSLPLRDHPYQSLYLGILNGYHVFSIRVEGDYDFNLFVFDQDGRIRDRKEIVWGHDGGSVDLFDQSLVQVQLFLGEDNNNGIEEINLQIDLNGQFKTLQGPEYVHLERKFPIASASILTIQFLESIPRHELKAMKNELLAANGYVFQEEALQQEFEANSWYVPGVGTPNLSSLEEYNLILIEQQLVLTKL